MSATLSSSPQAHSILTTETSPPKRARRRKARAWVHRLPPELIVEIFLCLQNVWPPRRLRREHSCYTSGWMTALHVCSFWRRAALSVAVLWQRIDVLAVHPDSAHELLARSGGLGLQLTFNEDKPDLFGLWTPHNHISTNVWTGAPVSRRLEILFLKESRNPHALWRLFTQEAPNIWKLSMIYIHMQDFVWNSPPPLSTLTHRPPQLRHLYLNDCQIPSYLFELVPALTHLKIVSVRFLGDNDKTAVMQALTSLLPLISLQYLHVEDFPCYGEHYYPRALTSDMVKLQPKVDVFPSLRDVFFRISDENKASSRHIQLLEHMSLPSSANFHTTVDFKSLIWEAIHPRMFNVVFGDAPRSDLCFELELRSCMWWSLHTWDSQTKARAGGSDMCFFSKDEDEYTEQRVLADVFASARICSINISRKYRQKTGGSTGFGLGSWPWLIRYQALQHVCNLQIHYFDHDHLWEMLVDRKISFSSLDTIAFTSTCSLWEPPGYKKPSFNDMLEKEEPAIFEAVIDADVLSALTAGLIGAVERRSQAGAPIQEVRIDARLARWQGWDNVRSVVAVAAV